MDSRGPDQFEQVPLDSTQQGRAQENILGKQQSSSDIAPTAVAEAHMASEAEEAVKDQIDDAIAKGPKKADASSGGRVIVAEQGDLHDLAARRRSLSK